MLRSGRRFKAQQHGYAYGSPPFGFEALNGSLVPVAGEQAAVARIVELRDGGATLREIAATLTTEGHQAKRSPTWHPESVKRILVRHGAVETA